LNGLKDIQADQNWQGNVSSPRIGALVGVPLRRILAATLPSDAEPEASPAVHDLKLAAGKLILPAAGRSTSSGYR
jgi:hypothetical protein